MGARSSLAGQPRGKEATQVRRGEALQVHLSADEAVHPRPQLPHGVQHHRQRRAARLLRCLQGHRQAPVRPQAQLPERGRAEEDMGWADCFINDQPCQQTRCPA